MKSITLLLLTYCIVSVHAFSRKVTVEGSLRCLDATGNFAPIEEGYAQLWEYDTIDAHDHVQTKNITYTGHFGLEGTESDPFSLEYFIKVRLPCTETGPLKHCVDADYKAACNGNEFAEFAYRFEQNPSDTFFTRTAAKSSYTLSCSLSYQSEKWNTTGLVCNGGLCNGNCKLDRI